MANYETLVIHRKVQHMLKSWHWHYCHERGIGQNHSLRPDFMAVSPDKEFYVIECKRGISYEAILSQLLDYAHALHPVRYPTLDTFHHCNCSLAWNNPLSYLMPRPKYLHLVYALPSIYADEVREYCTEERLEVWPIDGIQLPLWG